MALFCDFSGDEPAKFFLKPGQSLICNDIEYFTSDTEIIFSLVREGTEWEGYIGSRGEAEISLYIGTPEAPEITFNGNPVTITYNDNTATFTVSGDGLLTVSTSLLPPDDVLIEFSSAVVTLTWMEMAGADSYNIYRSDAPYFTPGVEHLIGSSTDTTFADSQAQGEKYFYKVTGVTE